MKADARQAVASAGPMGFSRAIVDWQKVDGRHSLPWQNTRDPYRVWLSEIMLQQTQVITVLDYYARFLQRFPSVAELAAAHEDEVLSLWSGLGYYSRARNLHRCAQQVVALHGGQFPRDSIKLQTLPGIGPSTAAAIASFCFAERVAILDGNVKRVLTRLLAFDGDLAGSGAERELWRVAEGLLPSVDLNDAMPRYTQGMMDLGATVCTRRKPRCDVCPVQDMCKGKATGDPEKYPIKTRKLKRSALKLCLLFARRPDGSIWLERRPSKGIWGGLYCLPVFEDEEALMGRLSGAIRAGAVHGRPFIHVLTHKDLLLHPIMVNVPERQPTPCAPAQEQDTGQWFSAEAWPGLGLPAPVRKLLMSGLEGAQLSP